MTGEHRMSTDHGHHLPDPERRLACRQTGQRPHERQAQARPRTDERAGQHNRPLPDTVDDAAERDGTHDRQHRER
jgi:hypothetical protein